MSFKEFKLVLEISEFRHEDQSHNGSFARQSG